MGQPGGVSLNMDGTIAALVLRTIGPKSAIFSYRPVFAPMWEHPDDPDLRAVAEAMFGDDRSPWAEHFLLAFNMKDLFDTPMMKLAPFRKRMLAELTKKDKAGILTITDEGYGQLKMDTGWQGGPGVDARKDPLAPKGPAKLVFRVCDYYAWQVARTIKGAPRCELYWPEADRDRAVAACATFLKRYEERR